jgi:hypothetical protein
MEIGASAAEEIRIATAEAVREATATAAREAAEQRALATAAATATAEAAAHEVGRQHQAYMRDLKLQQREEKESASAERQLQMAKRETELLAEKEAAAEDQAQELRLEEEETEAANQRAEEETTMRELAAMSAKAERLRAAEDRSTVSMPMPVSHVKRTPIRSPVSGRLSETVHTLRSDGRLPGWLLTFLSKPDRLEQHTLEYLQEVARGDTQFRISWPR